MNRSRDILHICCIDLLQWTSCKDALCIVAVLAAAFHLYFVYLCSLCCTLILCIAINKLQRVEYIDRNSTWSVHASRSVFKTLTHDYWVYEISESSSDSLIPDWLSRKHKRWQWICTTQEPNKNVLLELTDDGSGNNQLSQPKYSNSVAAIAAHRRDKPIKTAERCWIYFSLAARNTTRSYREGVVTDITTITAKLQPNTE